ncbi:hypothetical protein FDK13_34175 [Dyadobacter frigoris]|uniref:ERF family protein n=1 Tax=Dyadobacter frigoris TaxID=2576211 RepID=A0A4U6CPC6_9BACT|nr:hypothetical protein FDK13_34175 [Dyadobacter frigoris]
MEKQTPQGQGSAITFARRYALCAMLNIAQDDDDGQSAEQKKPEPKVDPISPERKAFIIDTIKNVKDIPTVKKLNTDAKAECVAANDVKAYDDILQTAKERIT